MTAVPLEHALAVAGALFTIGAVGVMARRNLLFMLVSAEIMMNAAGFAFVAAGQQRGEADGQVMFLFVLAMSAAEVALGLVLVLQVWRHFRTLDTDALRGLRG
jgi:NADH-quinone oxidoreductase subunit K